MVERLSHEQEVESSILSGAIQNVNKLLFLFWNMVVIEDVALELGRIGLWIQAVGLIVVLWIIIQAITLYFNRRRRKMIEEIREDVKKIGKKIDKLSRKRK